MMHFLHGWLRFHGSWWKEKEKRPPTLRFLSVKVCVEPSEDLMTSVGSRRDSLSS